MFIAINCRLIRLYKQQAELSEDNWNTRVFSCCSWKVQIDTIHSATRKNVRMTPCGTPSHWWQALNKRNKL